MMFVSSLTCYITIPTEEERKSKLGVHGDKSLAVERAGTESRMPAARETGSRDTVPWGAERQG